MLDGVEDPHNFGAILRSVDAVGRARRRSTDAAFRAARAPSWARHPLAPWRTCKIADVVNVARAVEELKEAGIWTVGLAGDAPQTYDKMDFTLPTAVIARRGRQRGCAGWCRERCDFLASIPMKGHVDSLNVSVAAGVVLFEAVRQEAGLKLLLFPRGIPCAKLSFLSGWRSSAR